MPEALLDKKYVFHLYNRIQFHHWNKIPTFALHNAIMIPTDLHIFNNLSFASDLCGQL